MITIVLADDHYIVRKGIRALLESNGKIKVVGEAADGLEAIEVTKELNPDVLVVDISMSNLNGLEVTRRVCAFESPPKVIILSMYSTEIYVLKALKNGASGYVLKGATDDLVFAIEEVFAGRKYLSSPISAKMIEAYISMTESSFDEYDTLTNREREVMQALAEGQSLYDIASRLQISPRTVEVHRTNIVSKLKLTSPADIVRYAVRKGIIRIENSD